MIKCTIMCSHMPSAGAMSQHKAVCMVCEHHAFLLTALLNSLLLWAKITAKEKFLSCRHNDLNVCNVLHRNVLTFYRTFIKNSLHTLNIQSDASEIVQLLQLLQLNYFHKKK